MCRYKADQHLIVLNLYRVSINKILVTEFIIVKVSEPEFNVKYISTMKSTTNRCVFSKVIKWLEQIIRKQIDCKRQSSTKNEQSTKYSNWNMQIKILPGKVIYFFLLS